MNWLALVRAFFVSAHPALLVGFFLEKISMNAENTYFNHYEKLHSSPTSNFDTLPDTGYLRQAQLIPHVVPVSSATLWRMCKSGKFPKPVKLSARVTAWNVGLIRVWLASQANKAMAV
jgi:predicted DNA-binding transcriptional regulator AlpA